MTIDEAIREARKTVKQLSQTRFLLKKDEEIYGNGLKAENERISEMLITLIDYIRELEKSSLETVFIYKNRIEELEESLFDMVFAYKNKDEDCPHEFEEEAMAEAENLLKGGRKTMKKIKFKQEDVLNGSLETDDEIIEILHYIEENGTTIGLSKEQTFNIKEAINYAIEALKRQKPRYIKNRKQSQVSYIDDMPLTWGRCPCCGNEIDNTGGFCKHCGQKIDWEEEQ